MRRDQTLSVAVNDDHQLVCVSCARKLHPDDIHTLVRHERGGVFDPLCLDCGSLVIRAAVVTLGPLQQIEVVLSP